MDGNREGCTDRCTDAQMDRHTYAKTNRHTDGQRDTTNFLNDSAWNRASNNNSMNKIFTNGSFCIKI